MRIVRQQRLLLCGLTALYCLVAAPAAQASERESLEQLRATTLNLIQLLVQEGVLSKEKAEVIIRQAEAARQPEALTGKAGQAKDNPAKEEPNVVRVQYVPKPVKDELREEIKHEVMAKAQAEGWVAPGSLPGWVSRVAFDGDVRLRYQLDSFPEGNALPANFKGSVTRNANVVDNTTDNRSRFRVRARLGANARLGDDLTGGIRMTTGSVSDPISSNQTLNTKDSKYSFALDRAFLKARPYPGLSLSGGRFANPFFSTDLVWDPDLAFDGVAANLDLRMSDSLSAFGTLGAFPMEEVQSSDTNKAKDKWMFGVQAGMEWRSLNQSSVKLGVALYDFKNVEGTANTLTVGDSTYNGTVLAARQKGNSTFDINKDGVPSCGLGTSNSGCGLASRFRELNLTGQIDLAMFDPVHVMLAGDYVRNIGFNTNDILLRTGLPYAKENQGYQVKLTAGMPKIANRHDWQVFGAYKRVGADAVLDAYTDSDFHLGGTDAKGWVLGGSYSFATNTSFGLRWFSTDEIGGLPLAIDVLMLDLNSWF